MTDIDDRSLYDRLKEVSDLLQEGKFVTIARAKELLLGILSEVYEDVREDETYFPGVSIITNPDDDDNEVIG